MLTHDERTWLKAQQSRIVTDLEIRTDMVPADRATAIMAWIAAHNVLTGEARGPIEPRPVPADQPPLFTTFNEEGT
jgi:hypothetical protein